MVVFGSAGVFKAVVGKMVDLNELSSKSEGQIKSETFSLQTSEICQPQTFITVFN